MSIPVNFELKKLFNIHISQNNMRLFITRNYERSYENYETMKIKYSMVSHLTRSQLAH